MSSIGCARAPSQVEHEAGGIVSRHAPLICLSRCSPVGQEILPDIT